MKNASDPLEAAFSSLRAKASGGGDVALTDDIMARLAARPEGGFPVVPALLAAALCLVAAFTSTRVLDARATAEPAPSLALFRADGSAGNPFTLR